jgi:hypothetical protein
MRKPNRLAAVALFAAAAATIPVSLIAMEWDAWWYILGLTQAVLVPAVIATALGLAGKRMWKRGESENRRKRHENNREADQVGAEGTE